jgi:eukaryotic-like serine/threonine-protein kinase
MNEETIFTQALAKRNAADRAAFLDEACAGNDTLRRQVDELIRSHEEGGSYLEVPAVFQMKPSADSLDRQTETTGGTHPLKSAQTPSDSTPETCADSRDDGLIGDEPLDFLDPPAKPGSLGRLGHYEVNKVVGRGGMGVVLRAFDTKLHRVVAIKVMAAELAANATARRRFAREAQAAAAVCHEHVVTIHAVDDENRPPYLVMQFVAGVSLQEKLDRDGALELREVLRIGLQTAEGLAAAHKQGLVHRDIKPANILLENGVERVKITDFGLARAADDASLTQSGVIAGTPQYMSPEQAEGAAVDQRTDLFSLGSVLYAACTGRAPFRGSSNIAVLKRVVEETPKPIRELNSDIPEWLCALIAQLQAKDPAERPASAAEVATILAKRLAELQQPIHWAEPDETQVENRSVPGRSPVQPAAAVVPSPRRPPARLLVVAAGLAVLLGVGLSEAIGVSHVVRTVIRLIRPEGTLVIEAEDAGVSVSIDGGDLIITGGGVHELRLRPGTHELQTRRGDVVLRREVIEIERGGRRVVRVTTAPPLEPTASTPRPTGDASPHATARVLTPDDWANSVFHLPVEEQVRGVSARLKELNPDFDGRVEATYRNGVVYSLTFCTDNVRDISPLGALRELGWLFAKGSEAHRGRLADIGPLQALRKLAGLEIEKNDVQSLVPLKGLPLVHFNAGLNPVSDLSPLSGMPLALLQLWNSNVSDLSPLAGMPLRHLNLTVTPVHDLSPLKGAPLEALFIGWTKVVDLSQLKGLPLKVLSINDTKVTNLDPVKGARLKEFHYSGASIHEISILRGMPLEEVTCNFQPARDAAILRSIPTLKSINGKPAADFWRELDARPAGVISH